MSSDQSFRLILASSSPRRRQLLTDHGYSFKVVAPDESVEAAISNSLTPQEFVAEAAFQKAKSIAGEFKEGIVLAADTLASCNGDKLGKPQDRAHAECILQQLSGTKHSVWTGVTVWNCRTGKNVSHVEKTVLEMAQLSDKTLQEYLNSDQWVGKAGAFGYQDDIPWIKIIEGLESNVVGLPVERIDSMVDRVK